MKTKKDKLSWENIKKALSIGLLLSFGVIITGTMITLEFLGYNYINEPSRFVRIVEMFFGVGVIIFATKRFVTQYKEVHNND